LGSCIEDNSRKGSVTVMTAYHFIQMDLFINQSGIVDGTHAVTKHAAATDRRG
jgi:hypothetical protein